MLDMEKLTAQPLKDPPWRAQPLLADGTLTVLAGKMGLGKTWILHEAAHAVATGTTMAGLDGTPGVALIIDGEMGEWLTVDRFQRQGYSPKIKVFDASGLNLAEPEHRQMIVDMVRALRPDFIGLDSLSALSAGVDENAADIGGIVNWIRDLCAGVQAAGLLLHHAGWKGDRLRGSTAIGGRADAVWHLTDEAGTLRMGCSAPDQKRPRYCAPPADIWLRIKPGGGLEVADAVEPETKADEHRDRILAALPVVSRAAAARAVGLSKPTPPFIEAWAELMTEGVMHEVDGVWTRNGAGPAAV